MPDLPTIVLDDPLFLRHQTGPGHPERPARLATILDLLRAQPVSGAEHRSPKPATRDQLARCHTQDLLDTLASLEGKSARLDEDTTASPDSYRAALLAAGAAVDAVNAVMSGNARNAFALVRPPGHHA